ncbi:ribosome biogenesis GTPase Der [Candidatus Uhrbacteria bacterium CG_4_9_14_3_um_filter_36_7]|uniref:GTPase Der n=1 Tax=Candidatus Uhrbacteria bacterium CG_4_9_14_3_um_filter_36_7 TaxID=1975033 RepID=A0A2M7XHP7_9BACT|nr:MAG: ribosome biogenesis GTPase Der [Candidatus Uhrbacteria bacterium CG_4_9_14_3_um_filter_36_7]
MIEITPPKIALIGRTNVGKSTLFNRLTEKNIALVSKVAGTTRDRKEADCLWRGKIIRLIDTGGLDVKGKNQMEEDTIRQTNYAIKQADVILFVVDLKIQQPLPQEQALTLILKKSQKPIIVVGNKAENPSQRQAALSHEWQIKGLPSPLAVSALRGTGIGDLLDQIYEILVDKGKPPTSILEINATRVAVIGKPNVGKSSLLNHILQEERYIVSPIAHTTREPNDTLMEWEEKPYVFIDTAGIRKQAKVHKAKGLEEAGVKRTKALLQKTDIALFVLESHKPLDRQDRTLLGLLEQARVGIILVANKWDLVENKQTHTMNEYEDYIKRSFPFLQWAPILFVSALTGQRVINLFSLINEVQENRYTKLSQEDLDIFLQKAMHHHRPKRGKTSRPPKILSLTQTRVAPPRFALTIRAKRKDALYKVYPRYLENKLHEFFPFKGTPVFVDVQVNGNKDAKGSLNSL